MIIEPPKTLEDFQEVRKTIIELMNNPWCDTLMLISLEHRLNSCDIKIQELNDKTE